VSSATPLELSDDCVRILNQGLRQLDLTLTAEQQALLLRYVSLLHKWNRTYNLTAIRQPEAMIERHLLDSLCVVPYISGQRIADVGTGPGLPGIVLAIVYPEKQFTLMDSNGKKTRFLQQVKQDLELDNIDIYNGRVEAYPLQQSFDTVISRAFASLHAMLTWTASLAAVDGSFLAMKGAYPEQELAELPAGFELLAAHQLQVPGSDAERHLLEFKAII
tara:strand:+ start:4748 stop:5404 length:657 start_codon:yes stop_codon:yes gene_type:complete